LWLWTGFVVLTAQLVGPPCESGVVDGRALMTVGGQTDAASRLEFVVVRSRSRRRRHGSAVVSDAAQEVPRHIHLQRTYHTIAPPDATHARKHATNATHAADASDATERTGLYSSVSSAAFVAFVALRTLPALRCVRRKPSYTFLRKCVLTKRGAFK